MSKAFTRAEVAEALDKVVNERGQDYVYPKAQNGGACLYSFEDGRPACIAGAVFALLDPEAFQVLVQREAPKERDREPWENPDSPVRTFRDNARSVYSVVGTQDGHTIGDPVEPLFVFVDDRTRQALRQAQAEQDSGETWGRARQAFVDHVGV